MFSYSMWLNPYWGRGLGAAPNASSTSCALSSALHETILGLLCLLASTRHFGLVDDELPSCSSLDPDDEDTPPFSDRAKVKSIVCR